MAGPDSQAQKPAGTSSTATTTAAQAPPPSTSTEPAVNRKKQKRRQKQAAKMAAEQSTSNSSTGGVQGHKQNGHAPSPTAAYGQHGKDAGMPGEADYPSDLDDNYESRDEELFYSEADSQYVETAPAGGANGKSKKKKKNKSRTGSQPEYQNSYARNGMPGSFHPPPPPPPPPLNNAAVRSAHNVTRDRIWNTSTAEERERIKEFWLSLEETQRRSLVKVEKEAVLKKMKEQQRNSCSCTVCGRKRTAIEEELEVLYDAYYEELEQYANHQQDGTVGPPPASFSLRHRPQHNPQPIERPVSSRGRITEEIEEEDDGDDEAYSDEEDSEDEDYYDEEPKGPATDFFNFGNSLTVQGGILTVADDLLKNDGKKFIEMMEQLAERRMAREKAHGSRYTTSPMGHPSMPGHTHEPPLEDDEDDFEDDEDYDDSQTEEYDDEDQDIMSEEQRMEEGRRMFQIFAARMFEQRVLTAYREKVAKERQEKLLEELADESRLDQQREAKRAKEAQKKKDRKKQQKAAKEEERQRREAEKAAEEAAAKALEAKKLEEQRQKKEEQRKKKEAEKKAQEEERLRKEAEKQKRLQEAREQQAETERKQREQKEKEKKKKEEAKRKEREEREAKEKEAKEKKEKEAAGKREREARLKAEREARDRAKKEEASKQAPQPVPIPTLLRKPSAITPSVPPGLQAPSSSNNASPHLAVATPVIPKASIPAKPRQPSHQGSHHSSPKSAQVVSESSATSPGSAMPPPLAAVAPPAAKVPSPTANVYQPAVSLPPIAPPPGMPPYPHAGVIGSPIMSGPAQSANYGQAGPGMLPRGSLDAPMYNSQPFSTTAHRGFPSPNALAFPPGINGIRHLPQGRGSPVDVSTTQAPGASASTVSWMPSHSQNHSRQTSASYDRTSFDLSGPSSQPGTIGRPAPIQRPSIVSQQGNENEDLDNLNSHLGSSALLDDTDENEPLGLSSGRNTNPRKNTMNRGFISSGMFNDPLGTAALDHFAARGMQSGSKWGGAQLPIGTPTMSSQPSWPMAPGSGWPQSGPTNAFGPIGGSNRPSSRPLTVRLLAAQACKQLSAAGHVHQGQLPGYLHLHKVLHVIDQLRPANEPPIFERELIEILDTEGNAQNGGGIFRFQDVSAGTFVRYEADGSSGASRSMGPPGEIGSPVGTAAIPFGRGGYPHGGGIPAPSGF